MTERRLSCCITFDFDGYSSWIGTMKSRNPSMVSRGQFGAIAIPRILDLLDAHGVRSTFAVPGHTAYAFPRLVAMIRDRGHELAHHGWVHENPAAFDEAGERNLLERGLEALERVAGVRPTGYRSPAWDLSERSVELLLEYGFTYDSSCMGDDTNAYYLRSGDAWTVDTPFHFGKTTELVELPVTWSLDDFPPFEFVLGVNEGLKAASAVEEKWRGDFDWAYAHSPGGIFNLTLHPQTIGRGHRMALLDRLLGHMRERDGVVFETLGAYAERWRKENPLEAWKAANPDLTGVHALEP
jgi:peptidoglycan/xylan/chitin deacetylase (PgdA/CDA1 family)